MALQCFVDLMKFNSRSLMPSLVEGNGHGFYQSLGLNYSWHLGAVMLLLGASRRFTTHKKSIVEIESVGVAGKTDIKSLEDGFVSVTPLSLLPNIDSETQAEASEWIDKYLNADQ
ncbi:Survival protein SurE-like phosphatase/nucleotidase [Raphanus sativus]|nr:Survival protein SurE-like phosphatase/nucleotidase [Raphanus sativus]